MTVEVELEECLLPDWNDQVLDWNGQVLDMSFSQVERLVWRVAVDAMPLQAVEQIMEELFSSPRWPEFFSANHGCRARPLIERVQLGPAPWDLAFVRNPWLSEELDTELGRVIRLAWELVGERPGVRISWAEMTFMAGSRELGPAVGPSLVRLVTRQLMVLSRQQQAEVCDEERRDE